MPLPSTRPPRILIQNVSPQIDCGRYPVKRSSGERVDVSADIFQDGHDQLRAVIRHGPAGGEQEEAPLVHQGNDRWTGSFDVGALGRHLVTIEAWTDRFASWQHEVKRKRDAAQADLAPELSEGVALLEEVRLAGPDGKKIAAALELLRSDASRDGKLEAALDPDLAVAVNRSAERFEKTVLDTPLAIDVDRPRARVGAWYELFPRSWGGFAGVERMLGDLAALGFDVLYLPPIHPIGRTNRKGRNNALTAGPADPGSPWATGTREEGGHKAIHPDLGTLEDFDRLVARAAEAGIEIALDFAIQCSPDHPWLAEHPEWFHRRPDGTLKYAENPPKKYQDIYNVNFSSPDWEGLWAALLDVVLFWVDHGVRVFRVDNPHTKPIAFWEWLIGEVRAVAPDVVFLSEAFTRPRLMEALAKVGFSQSYTYFTWRNSKAELMEYMIDLTETRLPDFFRPNFFANTPDILHEYLQHGGRPAFISRLVLAGTLSPSYGIYSGYEHCENVPVREGSEEYLDSEKYEAKQRRLDGPLLPLVGRLNAARRENPALQRIDNLVFLETANDQLIAYAKRSGDNVVITCVNLDPHHAQEGLAVIPASLGLPPSFTVRDLLTDETHLWRIGRNYLRLDPAGIPAHVLRPES